jgi:hypothetical protein
VSGIRVQGTALRCTNFHRFQAAAVFYPNFYPKRQHSGIEMPYLLVTAANWKDQPWYVTSLPSWSCGFDSRRPLYGNLTSFTIFDLLFHRLPPNAVYLSARRLS